MSPLFDDRASAGQAIKHVISTDIGIDLPLGLVPPVRLGDRLVCTGISSNGGHDDEVVLLDDLFHLLDGLEIPEHVPGYRTDQSGEMHGINDGSGLPYGAD